MKQTAVEWLFEQIDRERYLTDNEMYHLIKQAKAMEKEQIIEAFKSGNHTEMRGGKVIDTIAEQYYNKTFKSE